MIAVSEDLGSSAEGAQLDHLSSERPVESGRRQCCLRRGAAGSTDALCCSFGERLAGADADGSGGGVGRYVVFATAKRQTRHSRRSRPAQAALLSPIRDERDPTTPTRRPCNPLPLEKSHIASPGPLPTIHGAGQLSRPVVCRLLAHGLRVSSPGRARHVGRVRRRRTRPSRQSSRQGRGHEDLARAGRDRTNA